MSLLSTLYVSGNAGEAALYATLQIRNDLEEMFLVRAYVPFTAALEDGRVVTFEPADIDPALPDRNSDGTQDLMFAVSNIDGRASTSIRKALRAGVETTVTLREYLSNDVTGPVSRPLTLPVKDGQWTPLQADIRAGFMNLLDTAWPRDLYNPIDFPGIRYLA